jgi:hypothetical protein
MRHALNLERQRSMSSNFARDGTAAPGEPHSEVCGVTSDRRRSAACPHVKALRRLQFIAVAGELVL